MKNMNHLGIDVGKRKCIEQRLKMTKEMYWMNSSLVMIKMKYTIHSQEYNHGECYTREPFQNPQETCG